MHHKRLKKKQNIRTIEMKNLYQQQIETSNKNFYDSNSDIKCQMNNTRRKIFISCVFIILNKN